jgi:hypothetical protein
LLKKTKDKEMEIETQKAQVNKNNVRITQASPNTEEKLKFMTPKFVKGETINPSKVTKKIDIDPLCPPIVKLTKMSIESSDKTYALARFRESTTYDNVRMYLGFFYHNNGISINNITRSKLIALINNEGLPTNFEELKELYVEYNERISLPKKVVDDDLELCRREMYHMYIKKLVEIRENEKKRNKPS